jgi:hypothetical protein
MDKNTLEEVIACLPEGRTFFHYHRDRYLLSLGAWGHDKRSNWRQTSRPGWNLVLHLNLPMQHQRLMQAAGMGEVDGMQWNCHPRDGERLTMA